MHLTNNLIEKSVLCERFSGDDRRGSNEMKRNEMKWTGFLLPDWLVVAIGSVVAFFFGSIWSQTNRSLFSSGLFGWIVKYFLWLILNLWMTTTTSQRFPNETVAAANA